MQLHMPPDLRHLFNMFCQDVGSEATALVEAGMECYQRDREAGTRVLRATTALLGALRVCTTVVEGERERTALLEQLELASKSASEAFNQTWA